METTAKTELIEKLKKMDDKFHKFIHGWHMINSVPIKEAIWESINSGIVSYQCSVTCEAKGNHVPGIDNCFDGCGISNKTAKSDGVTISMSSYRLTGVCNDENPGNEQEIINEIKKRNENFHYHSLLIRHETETIIEYIWFMIPKDSDVFAIDTLDQKIGIKGDKKGQVVGWKSQNCDITFSMSSQLWYKFDIKKIEKYKICSTKVDNSKPKINYSQIYNLFNNTI